MLAAAHIRAVARTGIFRSIRGGSRAALGSGARTVARPGAEILLAGMRGTASDVLSRRAPKGRARLRTTLLRASARSRVGRIGVGMARLSRARRNEPALLTGLLRRMAAVRVLFIDTHRLHYKAKNGGQPHSPQFASKKREQEKFASLPEENEPSARLRNRGFSSVGL